MTHQKTNEKCLRCDWWDHAANKCVRVLKGRLIIGHGAGELDIETNRGLIPEHLQDEFEAWIIDAITSSVDSYPGWPEIERLRQAKGGCAGHKANKAKHEFGKRLTLVKPLIDTEPQPELNLDSHGLFKADISLW